MLLLILPILALLSGTLRTIQRAACDGEMLTLRCPLGTAVSIQLAQYGRPAPGLALCSSSSSSTTAVAAAQNDTCPLTPQMQVRNNTEPIYVLKKALNQYNCVTARSTANGGRGLRKETSLQILNIRGCECGKNSSFAVVIVRSRRQ